MARTKTVGRWVTGKLVQGADGVWREDTPQPKKTPRNKPDDFSLDNIPKPQFTCNCEDNDGS